MITGVSFKQPKLSRLPLVIWLLSCWLSGRMSWLVLYSWRFLLIPCIFWWYYAPWRVKHFNCNPWKRNIILKQLEFLLMHIWQSDEPRSILAHKELGLSWLLLLYPSAVASCVWDVFWIFHNVSGLKLALSHLFSEHVLGINFRMNIYSQKQ